MKSALGLIEMLGFVGVTEAADAATKAAAVELSAVEQIDGGIISIRVLGDVGAVQAAVEAGVYAAQQVGTLVAHHVIPNPHEDLVDVFGLMKKTGEMDETDLESLPVYRLRQIARETPGVGIQGREISRANRAQLLSELHAAKRDQTDA
ncbi:MAG: BMC domain-containing protein [Candidatus Latescibacteria bacterium]|nr:BMC domain-containing protein [Candidatus Latescibacterota bacterium]